MISSCYWSIIRAINQMRPFKKVTSIVCFEYPLLQHA
uniref:Uncharacterized protein n=1 Tax=Arundo donax TaxID=35708 RepID=A0A0A9AM58_ARUDO